MANREPTALSLDLIALVTSAGGLEAVSTVLRGLPGDLPAAVLVQQHLSGSGSTLATILRRRTPLPVAWAEPGARLQPGHVLVTPPRKLLEVLPDGSCDLTDAPDVVRGRPHDQLLTSLADSYGPRALAVVLTGMGTDGAAGVRALRDVGAVVIAQSQDTAEQPAMPRAAAGAGAQLVLPLHEIAGVVADVVLGAPLPPAPDELRAIRATFGDDGRIAALARETDWSDHPLGPVRRWPPALCAALRLAAAYPTPFTVLWGPDLVHFYNDAAIASHGDDHPRVFARPTFESYPHRRDTEPMLRSVLAGRTVQRTQALSPMVHGDTLVDAWFDLVYAPIPDADGTIAGLTCAWNERTGEVVGSRRLETLNRLGAVPSLGGPSSVLTRALAAIEQSPDVSFGLAYRVDAPVHAQLVASFGVPDGGAMAPPMVRLAPGASWPLQRVVDAGGPVVVADLAVRFRGHVVGPDHLAPDVAVLHPLRDEGTDRVAGVVVLGATRRLPFDDRYREFLTTVGQTVSAKVAESYAREREQHRLTQLAELSRARTEFFSNVSHEFRTPLTLVLAPLEDALRRAEQLPDDIADELAIAQRNACRLLRLVDALLDVTQIEAGRLQARYHPTDLAELTGAITSVFRGAAEAAGLKLTVDTPPLPHDVWVDPGMWEKVVSNLVSNALKFTWTGGVEVSLRALPKHAELVVRDTGVGIPADQLPHVLQRFHRGPHPRGRTHEGAGIGLALVDELVRRHHGRIRITSDEGAGTTATVWIPLGRRPTAQDQPGDAPRNGSVAAAMAEEASHWDTLRSDEQAALGFDDALTSAVASSSTAGARLLVVDDNADMRDYLARLLGSSWQVTTAGDGEEAFALARQHPPDLVLADVMRPSLDGFGLLRALRADATLAPTPVLLLTARAGEEAAIEGLLAGADDHVVKPFSARELVARVAAQLELAGMRRRVAATDAYRLALTDALQSLEDPTVVQQRAVGILRRQLGADDVHYAEVDHGAGVIHVRAEDGAVATSFLGSAPLAEWGGELLESTLGQGRTLVVDDVTTADIDATGRAAWLAVGVRAGIEAPLVRDGRWVGHLAVLQDRPRHWTPDEIALVEETAARTWAFVERTRAEGAVRELNARLEEQFRALAEVAGQTVWTTDADGRVVEDSPTWRQFTGQTVEEWVGEGWVDAVHPDDRECASRRWAEAVATGRPVDARVRLRHADSGSWHLTRVRAIPLHDRGGTVRGWLGMNTDLAARG
jgi:PAS domain S-box-containing protein